MRKENPTAAHPHIFLAYGCNNSQLVPRSDGSPLESGIMLKSLEPN